MGDHIQHSYGNELWESILQTPTYSEHAQMKNYALFRDSCIQNSKTIDVLIDQDIRERYMKAYELIADIYLEANYPHYGNIIGNKKPFVSFETSKIMLKDDAGHINYFLEYGPESIEFNMAFEPMFLKCNQAWYTLTTFMHENKMLTMMKGFHPPRPQCINMYREFLDVIKQINIPYTKSEMSPQEIIFVCTKGQEMPDNLIIKHTRRPPLNMN